MNRYVMQVAQGFMIGSGPTKGVMAVVQVGIMLATKLIVGEPDNVEGNAPTYDQLCNNIQQIGSQAQQASGAVQFWQGPAAEAFRKKVSDVVQQVQQTAPMLKQMGELLRNAAQAAKEAAQSLQQLVREVVTMVEVAYQIAQAAASVTYGASLAKWFAWAIAQAARLLAQVIKIVKQIADFLNKVATVVKNLQEFFQKASQVINALCKLLGVEQPKDPFKWGGRLFGGEGKPDDLKLGGQGSYGQDDRWKLGKDKIDRDREWGDKFEESDSKPKFSAKYEFLKAEYDGLWGKKVEDGGSRDFRFGKLRYHGELEFAIGKSEASVYTTGKGVGAEASVFAGLRAAGDGQFSSALGTTKGELSGEVGGRAEAKVRAGWDSEIKGAKGEVGAFAGARAQGGISHEAGPVGVGLKGEAWAGVGAEADGKIAYEDGKFKIGASAGAGLGVGLKAGFEVTLDLNKVVDGARGVASDIRSFFK
ncbi:hypothetical protein [Tessaracoccus sp. OH4464_COT-324]|uniref:hypothetical protein n=1 Tax=Tessaracoccus sp. OH4464_COT-324 TaxID=2491059 RepID=UPI000F62CC49|nr:hypothetical protein [Tessaracoccus sp. OH4464_COT-324]RRD46817.1 hypothetical protein EII42_05120 [Tessaracoccus sp. OH4464_COT-324]